MNITLYGLAGWALVVLAVIGATRTLGAVCDWLAGRFHLDLNLRKFRTAGVRAFGKGEATWDLWIGIPRTFKVHRRWDRPGALVDMGGGRQGYILAVHTDPDTDGAMAVIQPAADDEYTGEPEWVPLAAVAPAGKENVA